MTPLNLMFRKVVQTFGVKTAEGVEVKLNPHAASDLYPVIGRARH